MKYKVLKISLLAIMVGAIIYGIFGFVVSTSNSEVSGSKISSSSEINWKLVDGEDQYTKSYYKVYPPSFTGYIDPEYAGTTIPTTVNRPDCWEKTVSRDVSGLKYSNDITPTKFFQPIPPEGYQLYCTQPGYSIRFHPCTVWRNHDLTHEDLEYIKKKYEGIKGCLNATHSYWDGNVIAQENEFPVGEYIFRGFDNNPEEEEYEVWPGAYKMIKHNAEEDFIMDYFFDIHRYRRLLYECQNYIDKKGYTFQQLKTKSTWENDEDLRDWARFLRTLGKQFTV